MAVWNFLLLMNPINVVKENLKLMKLYVINFSSHSAAKFWKWYPLKLHFNEDYIFKS